MTDKNEHNTKQKPPRAEVIEVLGDRVVIQCPLCGHPHSHPNFQKNRIEHRVAACGIWSPVSQSAKALGYYYKVRQAQKETND